MAKRVPNLGMTLGTKKLVRRLIEKVAVNQSKFTVEFKSGVTVVLIIFGNGGGLFLQERAIVSCYDVILPFIDLLQVSNDFT